MAKPTTSQLIKWRLQFMGIPTLIGIIILTLIASALAYGINATGWTDFNIMKVAIIWGLLAAPAAFV